MATSTSKMVQSIHGSELLYEELSTRDASSGYLVSRIKLSNIKRAVLYWYLSLVMIVSGYLLGRGVTPQGGILTVLLVVLALVALHWRWSSGTSEAVVAVDKVGVQVIEEQTWRGSSRFIPLSAIGDVIINEAIYRHRVIFYLALLVNIGKEDPEIVPLFTSQMPRLDTILIIYRTLKSTLSNPV